MSRIQVYTCTSSPDPRPAPSPPCLSGLAQSAGFACFFIEILQCVFPKNKDIFLYNYSTVLTIKNIILTKCCYVLITHNTSRITHMFGGYVFFKLPSVWNISSVFNDFEEFRTDIFRFSSVWICLISPNDWFSLHTFGRHTTEMMLCPQVHHTWRLVMWVCSILMILSSILYLRWSCFSIEGYCFLYCN